MKEEIIKIMLGWVERNEPIETTADKLLDLYSVSMRFNFPNFITGLMVGIMICMIIT